MVRKKSEGEIERIFFTFTEAQEFLGISHQIIYKLMKEGLPFHKIGKKRVFLMVEGEGDKGGEVDKRRITI